jgi:triacylglycerol lipase
MKKKAIKIGFAVAVLVIVGAAWLVTECRHRHTMKPKASIEGTYRAVDRYEWVVLVHGLMSSPRAMRKIHRALDENGYRVLMFKYDSRNRSIRQASEQLGNAIRESIPPGAKAIHFVSHSLGSIVVRYYLAQSPPANLGRFVMIAPPNHGSTWGRILTETVPGFEHILGVAGSEVRYDQGTRLPGPPPCEFAVIAGGTGGSKGINPLIPGDNDGTVSVSETRLDGMKDHLVVRGQHTLLLFQKKVIDNVVSFLGTGIFLFK